MSELFEIISKELDRYLFQKSFQETWHDAEISFANRLRDEIERAGYRKPSGIEHAALCPRTKAQKIRNVKEISGIFDITGGLEASEYIRRMRDA